MPRPASIDDEELLRKLSGVFRDVGYEGASLTELARATGLKKASLYHRFPGGKEQMAREVLAAADAWLAEHVLGPLAADSPPEQRIERMAKKLDSFYAGGRQACLLNTLSSSQLRDGPFAKDIRRAFRAWILALSDALEDAGFEPEEAKARAERAVALLQGSLVVARGLGSGRPFRDFLRRLPDELLGER